MYISIVYIHKYIIFTYLYNILMSIDMYSIMFSAQHLFLSLTTGVFCLSGTVSKEKMTFALCLEDRCLSLQPTLGFVSDRGFG